MVLETDTGRPSAREPLGALVNVPWPVKHQWPLMEQRRRLSTLGELKALTDCRRIYGGA
jgi:hypothetical protein